MENNNVNFTVRNLKTKDFFKVATILGKMTKTSLTDMKNSTDEKQAGLVFVNSALQHAETDVKNWLSDLIGKTPQELDELPFDTPIEIIEQLSKKEDLTRFFTRVKSLTNKTELLR